MLDAQSYSFPAVTDPKEKSAYNGYNLRETTKQNKTKQTKKSVKMLRKIH